MRGPVDSFDFIIGRFPATLRNPVFASSFFFNVGNTISIKILELVRTENARRSSLEYLALNDRHYTEVHQNNFIHRFSSTIDPILYESAYTDNDPRRLGFQISFPAFFAFGVHYSCHVKDNPSSVCFSERVTLGRFAFFELYAVEDGSIVGRFVLKPATAASIALLTLVAHGGFEKSSVGDYLTDRTGELIDTFTSKIHEATSSIFKNIIDSERDIQRPRHLIFRVDDYQDAVEANHRCRMRTNAHPF